jgi:hypothetical protein
MIDAGDGRRGLNLLRGTRRVTLFAEQGGKQQMYAEGRLVF